MHAEESSVLLSWFYEEACYFFICCSLLHLIKNSFKDDHIFKIFGSH